VKSLDTNVLARFFVDDEDDEQAKAQRPLAVAAMSERCWVSITVILELEWVLRGFYELAPADVCRVMTALAGIEHVQIEDRDAVLNAVDSARRGMDFADALHLARSGRAASFVSFDRRLAKRAVAQKLLPAVELLKS
jgi:predicted nucleic-acid-binding protein